MNTEATQQRVRIDWMIRRDMPQVMAIEAASFPFPWTEEQFIKCLKQRNCIGMVAKQGDAVVGFVVYDFEETGIRLLNLAVAPESRRQGVGRQMIQKLFSKLSPARRHWLACEVREGNVAAQLFLRQCGFRASTIVHGFYEETTEAAIMFEFRVFSELAL